MTQQKIHWSDVAIWDEDGNLVENARKHRELLSEYRDTGSICQHWLVDPADYTEETCEEMVYAGPAVEEINWIGIDEP